MANPEDKKTVLSAKQIDGTLADIAELVVIASDTCGFEVIVSDNALDQFAVQGKFKQDGEYQTLFEIPGDFTSPTGLLVGASGDLTTQAVGTGWMIMDCDGLYSVKLQAASGSDSGVTVKGSAK